MDAYSVGGRKVVTGKRAGVTSTGANGSIDACSAINLIGVLVY